MFSKWHFWKFVSQWVKAQMLDSDYLDLNLWPTTWCDFKVVALFPYVVIYLSVKW